MCTDCARLGRVLQTSHPHRLSAYLSRPVTRVPVLALLWAREGVQWHDIQLILDVKTELLGSSQGAR